MKLFNKERSHSHIPKSDRTSKILIIKAIAPPTTQKSDRPPHPKKRSHLSHPKSDRPPTSPKSELLAAALRYRTSSTFPKSELLAAALRYRTSSHPKTSDRPPKSPNSDRTPTPLNSDRHPTSQKAIIRFEHRTRWYSHHCCE